MTPTDSLEPQRAAALESWFDRPNLCEECGEPISLRPGIPVSRMRRQRFCSHRCSMLHIRKAHPEMARQPGKGRRLPAIEAHGGACHECGYSRCVRALGFHSLDGPRTSGWVPSEGERAVLLCANCQAEVRDGLRTVEICPIFG